MTIVVAKVSIKFKILMKRELKSFFEGIEEALHFTPIGIITVPLWAFRKRRSDWWIIIAALSSGATTGLLLIQILFI